MTRSSHFFSTIGAAMLAASLLAPAANASLHDQASAEQIAETIVPLKVVQDFGKGRFIATRGDQVFYVTNGTATPLDPSAPIANQIDAIEEARN